MIRNHEHIRKKLKSIKAFILDMDGTIYLGNTLFPYTLHFLNRIRETNRTYYFFTNNSSKNVDDYVMKLSKMKITITKDQMMISTHVMLHYLQHHYRGKRLYVVGTPALLKMFIEQGWTLDDQNPDIVILGFDTTLTYEKLIKACHFIRNNALYFGINPDRNCPVENNQFIPDCGSIARLIESSTLQYPVFFGKPSHHALQYIIDKTALLPEQIAIIGDRLYTDIAIAQNTQSLSILVLSGETHMIDLKSSKIKPDIVIENIGVLTNLL